MNEKVSAKIAAKMHLITTFLHPGSWVKTRYKKPKIKLKKKKIIIIIIIIGDLRRLAVTQTLVKNHRLTLM